MARRKPRRLLVTGVSTPQDVARSVVDRYVGEARAKLTAWRDGYVAGINGYLGDATKQGQVAGKLANWYNIYLTVIYPEVKRVFATGRAQYIGARATAPTPPPPA